jgi:transketolase
MRKAFIRGLICAAEKDPRIMLITGDLGFRFLEPFASRFPDRFLNIGVAEANLVSVAAGLASVGFAPFIYSIATFASMRAFEQIRDDISLQNLNVKIVGIGAGFSYTKAGPTHHSYEDIALMRTLPNMIIVSPTDTFEAEQATLKLAELKRPAYLRLERNPETESRINPNPFALGKGYVLDKGQKAVILVTGTKVDLARQVAHILYRTRKISIGVAAMPTVQPIDSPFLKKLFADYPCIITLEEHAKTGGFGSAVLEWANESDTLGKTKIIRLGLSNNRNIKTGDYASLMSEHGLTAKQIARLVGTSLNHG